LRDFFGCGVYFLSFETAKERLQNTPGGTVIAGASAGISFWLFALPFDTIKTRVQTGGAGVSERTVWLDVWSGGWSRVLGLWRGWQVAIGRGAPSAAITLVAFEEIKKMIG